MSFEVVMLTPIVKRKILTKEIFGFIKNHKTFASLKFLPPNNLFSPMFGVPWPSARRYIVRRLSTFKDIRSETGLPWGGISDLEVFAKKSRDRLTNKWNLGVR